MEAHASAFVLLALVCAAAGQQDYSTSGASTPGVSQPAEVTVSVPLTCKLLDIDTKAPPSLSRKSCNQPCVTTGQLNYTVPENSLLEVDIYSPSTTVVMGGSQTDTYMNDPVPDLKVTTKAAPANPTSNTTITSFTWRPSRAIYPTFPNGTSALLSVRCLPGHLLLHKCMRTTLGMSQNISKQLSALFQVFAFDTSEVAYENDTYYARSCCFNFNVTVEATAEPPTQAGQLFSSGAKSIITLDVLPLAVLTAAAMLVLSCLLI